MLLARRGGSCALCAVLSIIFLHTAFVLADDGLDEQALAVAEDVVIEAAVDLPVVDLPVLDLPVVDLPTVDQTPVIPAENVLPVAEVQAEEIDIPEVPAPAVVVEAVAEVEELPPVEPEPVQIQAAEVPVEAPAPVLDIPFEVERAIVEEPPVIHVAEEVPVAQEAPAPAVVEIPQAVPVAVVPEVAAPVVPDDIVESALKEAAEGGVEPLPDLAVTMNVDPETAKLSAMMSQEAIRRKAYERHAIQTLEEAEREFLEHSYDSAKKLFEEAERYLGLREGLDIPKSRIQKGMADTCYALAGIYWQEKDWDNAINMAKVAKRYGHPHAELLRQKIEDDKVAVPPPPPPPKVYPRRYQPEYQTRDADLSKRLEVGKQYIQTGELDKAKELFESILKRDPYNSEAIRMLEKVARRRFDTAVMERETTRKNMMTEVTKSWNPRDYAIMEDFKFDSGSPTNRITESSKMRDRILEKMQKIRIPEIDFRQANINDVIFFLQEQSVAFDTEVKEGERKGVNLVLNLNVGRPSATVAATVQLDPFAPQGPDAGADLGLAGDVPPINCKAQYISLLEALDLVVTLAGLKYRIENSIVMVVPRDAPDGAIVNRMYDVLPSVNERIAIAMPSVQAGGGLFGGGGAMTGVMQGGGEGERSDWKEFFGKMGVPWPQGSYISYVPSLSKVVVANTEDNLSVFERILAEINVLPSQIEIEARFVEVLQTDLDSLGFEWLLTDDWELLQKKGMGGIPRSSKERVIVRGDTSTAMGGAAGSFTRGLRFPIDNTAVGSVADDVLSIASVLTNPELNFVIHAISQKGNTDLLSAPKVTTKAGTQATIKVVTEYIYPTDFEVTPVTAQGSSGTAQIVGGVVQPGGFQTREVGVLLEVLPEVSPEGQMINLQLTPQVVDEPTWKDYGSRYTDPSGNTQVLTMEQPFFPVRSVTTSLTIFNGATVVMGGMITEHRNDVDDKVPLLGDIPLLGRLFRSKYDHSEKRNLLIFVTARLVDPAGRPLRPSSPLESSLAPSTGAVAEP